MAKRDYSRYQLTRTGLDGLICLTCVGSGFQFDKEGASDAIKTPCPDCAGSGFTIASKPEGVVLSLKLHDQFANKDTPARVVITPLGIEIHVEGHGTCNMEPGHGSPIFIEMYEGQLRLHAWANINQEDPTHRIDFDEARESARKG